LYKSYDFYHISTNFIKIFFILEQCDLFRPATFLSQLHTNRVIVSTWIFSPQNVPCDRKDFLPWSPVRFNFSFHELFQLWSQVIRDIQAFFATDARRKLYWLYPAHPFRAFFSCVLFLSLFLLNYHSTFRRSMQEKVSLNYTCTKVICLFSCTKHVTFTKKNCYASWTRNFYTQNDDFSDY